MELFLYILVCKGSPPHARGKAGCVAKMEGAMRITPARAGKR